MSVPTQGINSVKIVLGHNNQLSCSYDKENIQMQIWH